MKDPVDIIIERYRLNEPTNSVIKGNHTLLIERETAFEIIHLLSDGNIGRHNTSSGKGWFMNWFKNKEREKVKEVVGSG